MWQDRQLVFMKKWFGRALAEDDPFDRFFSLWICLVVAAQRARTVQGGGGSGDRDREKVKDYFRLHAQAAVAALRENDAEGRWLASRRGTRLRTPLVDNGASDLREKFTRLSAYLTGRRLLEADEVADCTAELLNRVRNNVFHGVKVYDDRDDLALLQRVNPILESVLRRAEPTLADPA